MKYIFLLAWLFSTALSQELETLLKQAFSEHPSVNAAAEKVSSSKEFVKISGTLPNPMLSGGTFIEPVVTKTGPQLWRAGISQKFPFMGKLSNQRKIAGEKSMVSEAKFTQTLHKIQTAVISAFENLRFHQKEVEITRQNLELAQHIETVIQSRYKTATARHPDLIQIQLKIMKLENRIQDLAEMEGVLLDELRYAVGSGGNISPVFLEPKSTIPESWDLKQNSELKIQRHILEISKFQNRLNRLASLPDFTAGVDYIRLDSESNNHPLMLKAGIDIPLWRGKNKALKKAGKASIREAELQLKDTEIKLETRLSRNKYELVEKHREIALYNERLIPHARLGFEASETAYLANSIPFTEFIFAFHSLLDMELKSAQALREFQKLKAGYFELTGQFLTDPEEGEK